MTHPSVWIGVLLGALSACVAHVAPVHEAAPSLDAQAQIAHVLDSFHASAAKADEEAYFAAFARNGTFLGTDASERWDVAAFRAYAHPRLSEGQGWTYVPRARHVEVHQTGESAWFDELLDHEQYGELRGSGVLVLEQGAWKIAQYNLTFTIPNAKAKEVVGLIKQTDTPAP